MSRLVFLSAMTALLAASGCTIQTTTDGADGGADVIQNGTDTRANTSTSTGTQTQVGDAGTTTPALTFVPSNISSIVADGTEDVQINGRCTIYTDEGKMGCRSDGFRFQVITQSDPDQTEVGVFVMGSLTIGADAVVTVVGTRPVALVTSGAMTIKGIINATPETVYMDHANAGGYSGASSGTSDHNGKGPGGGRVITGTTGAGGGAYCGKGGGTNGGTPYGNPEISPLIGGSSGAMGGYSAGAGGGALQLVSATSITLTSQAKINVGGGGGGYQADGGGSGGAVLLEAPHVTIGGTIAANGGSGSSNNIGSGTKGASGTADSTAAPTGAGTNPGGMGSAGTIIDGGDGSYDDTSVSGVGLPVSGGGGGGGAGRIRINTVGGQATITGVLSPAASTNCFSQGTLKTK